MTKMNGPHHQKLEIHVYVSEYAPPAERYCATLGEMDVDVLSATGRTQEDAIHELVDFHFEHLRANLQVTK